MLFTAHVDLVAPLQNHKQGQGGEYDESNDDLPHGRVGRLSRASRRNRVKEKAPPPQDGRGWWEGNQSLA